MPLYEYLCRECDTKFEKLLPMSQVHLDSTCPECDIPSPRVLSVFAAFTSGEGDEFMPIAGAGGGCACGGPGGCACASMN